MAITGVFYNPNDADRSATYINVKNVEDQNGHVLYVIRGYETKEDRLADEKDYLFEIEQLFEYDQASNLSLTEQIYGYMKTVMPEVEDDL